MDKNEVITLSSDEESDFTHRFEKSNTTVKSGLKDSILNSCLENFKSITVNKKKGLIISREKIVKLDTLPKVPEKKEIIIRKEYPEIVDLEGSEKSVEDDQVQFNCTNNNDEKHSNLEIIEVDEVPKEDDTSKNAKISKTDVTSKNVSQLNKVQRSFQPGDFKTETNKGSDQNLKFFTEFVEFCGCLEEIPNDRARLTKKLMKRYGEADSNYIKTEEFRNLIKKCRDKVNKNNLYLIAKEITDELSYRKKFEINTGKSNLVEDKCQRQADAKVTEKVQENSNKRSKKRTKIINKIIKKLDKLGCKIRELEEQEVDLSDEEESSYVQLQRYRDRFCQIYAKLCKYTDEVADADRIYSRRICFTESKYPKINKCIENWLNKTKRFPDFTDIMKLLESQSASLGLPSNRESIRVIAIEIFQKVGMMLQRRRKYDLWDSFSGFLDEGGEDPAANDTTLDRILKHNFDTRLKKEQEIFQHFAQLQEEERLEPEEVPDDEANHSPVESGNEDDKEIEDIENSLNKRLDDAIKKDTEENDKSPREDEWDEGKEVPMEDRPVTKESKNNYRNCKSLKWRQENGTGAKSDSVNSEDSATGPEMEKEGQEKLEEAVNAKQKPEVQVKNEICGQVKIEAVGCLDSPLKRKLDSECEESVEKKRKLAEEEKKGKELDIFEVEDETDFSGKKTSEVFQVHCCQIYPENVFEGLEEGLKDYGKRKVFRDLTNVSRLMELHGRQKEMSGLFSPSFFRRRSFELGKPSWKKRFKVSFKLVGSKGQKCALNQEEKPGKSMKPDSDGDGKNNQNNSEGTGDDEDRDNAHTGRGSGSEGDNNEDENKKNGRTGDELNENQHDDDDDDEEEEEEEENEAEKEEDNKPDAESDEHSFQKTEEPSDGNETPSDSANDWEETGDKIRQPCTPTEEAADLANTTENQAEKIDQGEEIATKREEEKHQEEQMETDHEEAAETDQPEEKEQVETAETDQREEKEQVETTETDQQEEKEQVETAETDQQEQKEQVETAETDQQEQKEQVEAAETDQQEKKEQVEAAETDQQEKKEQAEAAETDQEEKKYQAEETESPSGESELNVGSEKENSNETEKQKEEVTRTTDMESESSLKEYGIKEEVEKPMKETLRNVEAEEKEANVSVCKESVECKVSEPSVAKEGGSLVEESSSETQYKNSEGKENEDGEKNLVVEVNDRISKNHEAEEVSAAESITKNESKSEGKDLQKQSKNNKVEMTKEDADVKAESQSPKTWKYTRKKSSKDEKLNMMANDKTARPKRKAKEIAESRLTVKKKPIRIEPPCQVPMRRSAPSTSDEERVKRFLLHSPSSISITPPRKLSLSKPPSQAAIQALAMLRNLKDISATIVRGGKPKNEDDVVVIGDSYRRRAEQNSNPKRRRADLPVISNVQSVDATTPKIVTVQGNVSGFGNSWPEVSNDGNSQCNSSSIRISNVWGSLPNTFMHSGSNRESVTPGCSFRKNNPGSSNAVKKKNAKKTVEYVVLD